MESARAPLTDRAEILAALKDAEDRAAGLRTSLAGVQEDVAVLHLELRRRWAADYGVRERDIPSAPADGDVKVAGGGGDGGSGGDDASVAERGAEKRSGGDQCGGSAGGTRRVKRERSQSGWPETWTRMEEKPKRGDGAPAGVCKGRWWLFQEFDGYRPHQRPPPDGACLLTPR